MNISSKVSGMSSLDRSGSNRWGWLIAICGGIVVGVLLGVLIESDILGRFRLGNLAGTITAGVAVALLAALLPAKRPVTRTLVADVCVAVSCIATMAIMRWPFVWPVNEGGRGLVIVVWLLFFICVPGTLLRVIIAAVRRRRV